MPKHIVKSAMILGLAVFLFVVASGASAQTLPPRDQLTGERAIGDPNAPVTLVEYFSLTCPHCAAFHNGPFVEIKKDYIDTGKVRMVYKDFPLDRLALAAAMAARCAAPERYAGFIQILYKSQLNWARAQDPSKALEGLSRLAGVPAATYNACVTDQELFNAVMASRNEGSDKFAVGSTPTFFVNGRKIEGSLPIEQFRQVLDEALASAKK